jgi:3-deoxy-7-phosphoheptulonate synthase
MLVVMRRDATAEELRRVTETIAEMGYEARTLPGRSRTAVGVIGNEGRLDGSALAALPGVAEILHVSRPYKQVSLEWQPERTVVRLAGGVTIGGDEIVVMAGPCSVESERQIIDAALAVRQSGAAVLRAGAFKPRSSPYAFQGLGTAGLALLARARAETGLLIVTEVVDAESVDQVAEFADIVQIGARHMQNHALLRRAGRAGRPVLLKRALSATIEDLLLSAEYLLAEGNRDVILCERGIRGFDGATRNLFDVSAIPVVRGLSHLPIVADPSHATGRRALVTPMALAAVAAGADGLLIEVHPDPDHALSDGAQSLHPEQFDEAMHAVRLVAGAIGRRVAEPAGVPI